MTRVSGEWYSETLLRWYFAGLGLKNVRPEIGQTDALLLWRGGARWTSLARLGDPMALASGLLAIALEPFLAFLNCT